MSKTHFALRQGPVPSAQSTKRAAAHVEATLCIGLALSWHVPLRQIAACCYREIEGQYWCIHGVLSNELFIRRRPSMANDTRHPHQARASCTASTAPRGRPIATTEPPALDLYDAAGSQGIAQQMRASGQASQRRGTDTTCAAPSLLRRLRPPRGPRCHPRSR